MLVLILLANLLSGTIYIDILLSLLLFSSIIIIAVDRPSTSIQKDNPTTDTDTIKQSLGIFDVT